MTTPEQLKAIANSPFAQQKAFILNKSRRKALFVPRRGAKTYAIAIYIVLAALMHPNVKIRYLGLTRESAENALWKDCLLKIFIRAGMTEGKEYKYNRSTKTVEFDNLSTIQMSGANTSFKEPAKLLGGKYFMAVIDECQHYTVDLEEIIMETLGPAVSDYIDDGGGQIILAGTAGPYVGKHYWHTVNTDHKLGWSIHSWAGEDNPYMAKQKAIEEADFLKQYGPDYKLTEWYRQQYLCKWIYDSSDRIYNFITSKCTVSDTVLAQKLMMNMGGYKYILSIDLGHNDATAITLLAWHKYDPTLYIVRSEKYVAISLDFLQERIQWFRKQYNITYFPIDSAGIGKMIVEDYRKRMHIPFEYPKSKSDKMSYIRMMNSDFMCSKIKVIEASNKELIEEWNTIMCDKKALEQGYRKEADRYHNDLADSCLYGFSIAKHYWAKPEPPILDATQKATLEIEKMMKKTMQLDKLKQTDDPFSF